MAVKGLLNKVIVVGTGPSGLVLSLLLARHGIPVELLEMTAQLDTQPRATHYSGPANRVLQKAGLLGKVREHGIETGGATWRKPDGTPLAQVKNSLLGDNPDRISCLPLNHLCKLVLEDLLKEPVATVKWNHMVTKIHHDENQARVVVETPDGIQELTADYVVGCDGANSTIRKQLFGDDFPGYTWDLQIIASNVYYDFAKYGWNDSNFIIHPENYYMAAKIQADGLWRVSYGEIPGLSTEEYRQRQPAKYESMLPGNPKPDQYKITNFSPYKVHHRLAKKMRVGRFVLAADAGHLCNPFGGLGLTGGLTDVGDLFACLVGIHDGLANDSILDKYDEIRQKKYRQFTDPISAANLKRMASDADEVEANDKDIAHMRELEKDPKASIEFQLGILGLAHDMTQYYNKEA